MPQFLPLKPLNIKPDSGATTPGTSQASHRVITFFWERKYFPFSLAYIFLGPGHGRSLAIPSLDCWAWQQDPSAVMVLQYPGTEGRQTASQEWGKWLEWRRVQGIKEKEKNQQQQKHRELILVDEIKGRKLQTVSVPEKCTVICLTVSLCAEITYREAKENFAGVIYFLPILWKKKKKVL